MKQIIIKLDMSLITIILALLQFKIDGGQSYSDNYEQSHFWGDVSSNKNHDVAQQNFEAKKHHHQQHHQEFKDHGNLIGRWAQQPGRGCFWTGCMSKLHQHYCPAATFAHEVNPCPSPALNVDVKCCFSRPQEVTQPKIVYTSYPPTTPTTATSTTTETTPPTTATMTTRTTTTVKTSTPTPPTTTITTETPPTTTTETPPTTTETPPTTTTEAPNTPPDYYEYIDITPSAQRKKRSVA